MQRENEFLWLHLSLSNTASERWMRNHLSLPDAFYQSLHEQISSTRVEQEDAALTAVIHDVLFDSSFDTSSVSTVTLCVGPRLLVSARLRPLRSVDRLRAAIRQGAVFQSSIELFSHLLRDQAGVLVDILRQSTIRVDDIEDKILENRISISRRELGALRRMLVRLQRLLAPEPAALFRLLRQPPTWIADRDVQDMRQAAEEFSAVVVDSAALVERVKLLQEELVALLNEQTNRTLFVLTLVTVMALPINLVAGLFGMNVGGIPLAQSSDGFWIVVTILAAVTSILAYLVSRGRD
jgi:zinc transporter